MRTQDKIHLNYCNEPGYPLSETIQIYVNSNKFFFFPLFDPLQNWSRKTGSNSGGFTASRNGDLIIITV